MSLLCFCIKISIASKGVEGSVMQCDEFLSLFFFFLFFWFVLCALRSDISWSEDARSDEDS